MLNLVFTRGTIIHNLIRLFICILFTSISTTSSALNYINTELTQGGTNEVIVSSDGKFVYSTEVFSPLGAQINLYQRNLDTGKLTYQESTTHFFRDTALLFTYGMVMSPDENQLYIVDTVNYTFGTHAVILWFSRNKTTGKLTYAGQQRSGGIDFAGLSSPSGSMTMSPDGSHLYVGDFTGRIIIFKREANGNLIWLSNVRSTLDNIPLTFLVKVSMSPDGKNLYATAENGLVHAYTRNSVTGALTPLQTIVDVSIDRFGAPGLTTPGSSIVSADGKFFYIVGAIENAPNTPTDNQFNVVTFQRTPSTGLLHYLNNTVNSVRNTRTNVTSDTLKKPTSLALSKDPTQSLLYVGTTTGAVNVFQRDPSNGQLRWLEWVVDGTDGVVAKDVNTLSISANNRHIYAGLMIGEGIALYDTRAFEEIPKADLRLSKADNLDPVKTSGTLQYTITVSNFGPATATNVIMTDILDENTTYQSSSVATGNGSCTENAGVVTCNLGDMTVDAVVDTTITVTAPTKDLFISNHASVFADQMDPYPTNNSAIENTQVGCGCTTCAKGARSMSMGGLLMLVMPPLLWRRCKRKTDQTI